MALRQSQHRCLETPELLPVPVVCRRLARVRHPSAQTGSGVAHELSRWNGFFKGLAEPLSGPFRRPNDLALLDTTPASCSDLVKGVAGIETTLGWHGFLKTPRRTPIARPSCRGRVRSPAAKKRHRHQAGSRMGLRLWGNRSAATTRLHKARTPSRSDIRSSEQNQRDHVSSHGDHLQGTGRVLCDVASGAEHGVRNMVDASPALGATVRARSVDTLDRQQRGTHRGSAAQEEAPWR